MTFSSSKIIIIINNAKLLSHTFAGLKLSYHWTVYVIGIINIIKLKSTVDINFYLIDIPYFAK